MRCRDTVDMTQPRRIIQTDQGINCPHSTSLKKDLSFNVLSLGVQLFVVISSNFTTACAHIHLIYLILQLTLGLNKDSQDIQSTTLNGIIKQIQIRIPNESSII